MFDNDPNFQPEASYHTAKDRRKLKKELLNLARAEFSDPYPLKMSYYNCLSNALKDSSIQGKDLVKQILACKIPLEKGLKFIEETNSHARIKVKRCTKSQRGWVRQWKGDLAAEEDAEWECMNRYHRRYLYYYPNQLHKLTSFE